MRVGKLCYVYQTKIFPLVFAITCVCSISFQDNVGEDSQIFFNGSAFIQSNSTNFIRQTLSGLSFRSCKQNGTIVEETAGQESLKVFLKNAVLICKFVANNQSFIINFEQKLSLNCWHHLKFVSTNYLQLRNISISLNDSTKYVSYPFQAKFATTEEIARTVIGANVLLNESFNGCLAEGPNFLFNNTVANSSVYYMNVVHGCPLNHHFTCELNKCDSSPCNNGGTCHTSISGFKCECPPRFNGTFCDEDLGPLCNSTQCLNNGTCAELMSNGEAVCQCPLYFYGRNCSNIGINPCSSNPCYNNGLCGSNENGDFSCYCEPGFTGARCDADIDECLSRPCQNGGICKETETKNNYTCVCNQTGFTGPYCMSDVNECMTKPCHARATCFNRPGDFLCLCPLGFGGQFCDEEIDECSSNPCMNDGTCFDHVGRFTCHCPHGYKGYACEEEIDYCINNDCNQLTQDCISDPGRYFCVCKKGFWGFNCTEINECWSNPCRHAATCVDEVDRFSCVCVPGYQGITCAVETNECATNPCGINGHCTDLINGYSCNCTLGWTGQNCTEVHAPCEEKPCLNGATCRTLLDSQLPGYSCQCPPGFQGYDCDVNIDDCANVTCGYNEHCVDLVETYDCVCEPGFAQDVDGNCSVDINECESVPCQHGSTCVDLINKYKCNCTYGYEGLNCELVTDFCLSHPCKNNGICQGRVGSYSCFCANGFLGLQCEYKHNPCESDPCLFGSTCHVMDGGLYRCECTSGYEGRNCEVDINECLSSPCVNGNCTDLVGNFSCACAVGWEGTVCDVDVDECLSSPCNNGSTCRDLVAGYECSCLAGYTGDHCKIDINDCEIQPCQNNGTCVDEVNGFSCVCDHTGFHGDVCEVEVDECQVLKPCLNGASCVDMINDYFCQCHLGYEGRNCEIDVDDCASQPCRHNATCVERSDVTQYGSVFMKNFTYAAAHGYVCICPPGYEGPDCETETDECASWRPCKSGSTCVDRLADYKCVCEAGFSGRNCTVRLRGCDQNLCAENSICRPYLLDEAKDLHNYSCQCGKGYTSVFCNTTTSLSFGNSRSHVTFSALSIGQRFTLDFRTTLESGILISTRLVNSSLKIELSGGSPRITLTDASANQSSARVIQTKMNDGDWWTLAIAITKDEVILQADGYSASLGLINVNNSPLPASDVELGGDGFVGCVRDVTVSGRKLSLAEAASYRNVSAGCARELTCTPTTCSKKGNCVDLWVDYRCDCLRPYKGRNCELVAQPTTFGHMGAFSSAVFQLSSPLCNTFDVSMFIKTTQNDSFLLSTSSDATIASTGPDFSAVLLEITQGKLKATTGGQSFVIKASRLTDGETHFVSVQIVNQTFASQIDQENSFNGTLSGFLNLTSSSLYVGGLTSIGVEKRRRRSTTSNTTPFKGTILDLRVNNEILLFNASDTQTEAAPYILPNVSTNLLPGEVSDPVCGSTNQSAYTNPCHNGALCDVTFNDYVCNCTPEWRGRNCDRPVFCKQLSCPIGLKCFDLDNGGFECLGSSTFNPSSKIFYEISNNVTINVTEISFKIRTRSTAASILFVPIGAGAIRFQLASTGQLRVALNTDSLDSTQPINDGLWHHVTLTANGTLKIDEASFGAFSQNVVIGGIMSRGNGDVAIGATEATPAFKGCVEDIRINQYLLPFYQLSKLTNHTAANRATPFFVASEMVDVTLSCTGDDVCVSNPCENEGTCVDEFNFYNCNCRDGFTSKNCDVNIDDCVNVTCSHHGNCSDAINGYACICLNGYTGHLCETEIDECDPSPCMNGGTCYDLIGSFRCDCNDTNFIGERCHLDTSQSCGDVKHHNYPCVNGGKCRNVTEGNKVAYSCSCDLPYTGSKCEVEMNPCENNKCKNGATCVGNKSSMTHICACAEGYTGVTCQRWIGQCSSGPCGNNGSCYDDGSGFNCTCFKGTVGLTCQYPDLCAVKRNVTLCANNGTCQVTLDTNGLPVYSCKCVAEFAGATCSFPNPCLNITCQNGGVCDVTNPSVTSQEDGKQLIAVCQCPSGFTGDFCETDPYLFSSSAMIVLIASVGGAGILLLLVLGAAATVSAALERRATSGTYSPSKQEASSAPPGLGGRLESEVWTELKPPPPCERLI